MEGYKLKKDGQCPEGYFGCFTTLGDEPNLVTNKTKFEICVKHIVNNVASMETGETVYISDKAMTDDYCPINFISLIKPSNAE